MQLQNFDPLILLSDYFRLLIIGSSQSGKSYYFANTIWPAIKKYYSKVFVFTKDANVNFYKKLFGYMDDKTTWEKIKDYVRKQDKNLYVLTKRSNFVKYLDNIKKMMMSKLIGVRSNGDPKFSDNFLILFDDILDDKMIRNTSFMDVFAHFRHLLTSTVFIVQSSSVVVSTLMKNNTNYFIFCKLSDINAKNRIINEFISVVLEDEMEQGDDESERKYKDRVKKLARDMYRLYIQDKLYGKLVVSIADSKIWSA